MKNKDIFKKLVGLEGGNKKWHVATSSTVNSEKWIYHILPADAEAPNIEDDRRPSTFLIISSFSLLFFILLSGRLFNLQILEGKDKLAVAEENRVHEDIIRAPRGIIYDSKSTALVKNIPNFDLSIIPGDLPRKAEERNNVFRKLSEITGMDENEMKSKINTDNQYSVLPVLIEKNIDKDKSLLIEANLPELLGVKVEVNPIREYLDNGLLSHLMGYVGRISEDEYKKMKTSYGMNDFIGKTGLEKYYEEKLKGINGKDKSEIEASGQQAKDLGVEQPIPGDNLKLSIDFELQRKVTESLQKSMEKAKVTKASAVAMNPQTGEILAIVSLPTYDNNLFAKGIGDNEYKKLLSDPDNPLLFRAISGEYPSGSVIKPYVASAALEEKTITESSTVLSNGGIKVGEFSFPDWKPGGHGVTNVTKAIAESVNTFFYAIGGGYQNIPGLGPEKIKQYLEKFGFDNYAGIDVPGEVKGSIPDPEWKERVKGESWYLGDTYHMAIGQGDVLVTPLQIANATCAIANGGKLYKPRVVNSILDANGNTKTSYQSEVINNQVVSPETIDIVKRGMRETVTAGSAKSLNSLPVEIAGKTGTAQFGPNNSKQHAWFSSFAPFNNPTFELTVLLEGAGGGDVYAVPVANDIYKWYFRERK
jgi:penicillin-binding protein 2